MHVLQMWTPPLLRIISLRRPPCLPSTCPTSSSPCLWQATACRSYTCHSALVRLLCRAGTSPLLSAVPAPIRQSNRRGCARQPPRYASVGFHSADAAGCAGKGERWGVFRVSFGLRYVVFNNAITNSLFCRRIMMRRRAAMMMRRWTCCSTTTAAETYRAGAPPPLTLLAFVCSRADMPPQRRGRAGT